MVQYTHKPSPSVVIHFKAWRGCETRSPRVIRSWSKRERWPVVEQGDPFSIEQPTLNVIHSIHSGVCVEWLGATSLIQIRRRWNRCLWWSPLLYIYLEISLSFSLLPQLRSFPLITVRSTEKAARTVNWLFELSLNEERERGKERERKRALKFSRKGESRGCNDSFFLRFRRRHSTINETLFLSDEQKRRCKRSWGSRLVSRGN